MKKKKNAFYLALAASIAVPALVVPTAAHAEEQELVAGKVVFNVDGQLKVITAEQYLFAVVGAGQDIKDDISINGKIATPAAVYIGNKYISAEDYLMQYMIEGKITQPVVENISQFDMQGAIEWTGSEWQPIDGQIQVFEILSID